MRQETNTPLPLAQDIALDLDQNSAKIRAARISEEAMGSVTSLAAWKQQKVRERRRLERGAAIRRFLRSMKREAATLILAGLFSGIFSIGWRRMGGDKTTVFFFFCSVFLWGVFALIQHLLIFRTAAHQTPVTSRTQEKQ